MAIGMILEWEGGTQQQYDKVVEALGLGGKTVPGGIFHAAGPSENGWRAMDVWESEEIANAFFANNAAVFEAAGVPQPKITVFPIHNTLTPSGPVH